ncbi:helix-turn-helix transcriptional regulator [Arthrobacter sp. HLT1-20]
MVPVFLLAHTPVVKVPELLEICSQNGIAPAPHVAAALFRGLSCDIDAMLEVAGVLTHSQLSGHSALPDPLPLLPGLSARVGAAGAELDAGERAGLLAAAICVEDRTVVLLAHQQAPMSELIASRLGTHLLFVAGRFSFVDPRMRVWVHGSASLDERTKAHIEMQRAYADLGDMDKSTWHESLATLQGDKSLVPALLRLSRKANAGDNSVWGHAVAREAASHAIGPEFYESQLCAGAAALNLGMVDDAANWLGGALASPDVRVAARALPLFVHAESLLAGEAHTVALARHGAAFLKRAEALDSEGFATVARQVAKATGLAAGLCAAGGMLDEAARLLDEAERLVEVHQVGDLPLCAARHLCAIFGGAVVQSACACRCLDGLHDFSDARVVMDALTLGLDDDVDAGLRLLHESPEAGQSMTGKTRGSGVRGAPTPLGLAYRAVVSALLQLWSGDVSRAAAELGQAAASVPVGLPFFGLGVILARRLDVLTTGEVGTVANAMEVSYPAASSAFIRTGDLMDRTLTAYLDGKVDEASTLGRLAAERVLRGAASPLYVPGFDEMAPRGRAAYDAGAASQNDRVAVGPRMPSGHRRASSARMALCSTDNSRFAKDYEHAVKVSVTLRSHYDRARTEFVLGRACLKHGTAAMAREHLVVAADLFREVGAMAWLRCVENTLDGVPEAESQSAVYLPVPDSSPGQESNDVKSVPRKAAAFRTAADQRRETEGGFSELGHPGTVRGEGPLQLCRQVWGELLTERELEVAMLVAGGAPNRQVAAQLHVSVRTVEVHLGHVFAKLSVRSRVELSVLAHRMGSDWLQADT